jgi:gluconate 5-dehydrogenase
VTDGVEGLAGIVTGGARGIGRGIVEAFVEAGAEVAIFDRDGADEAAAELGDAALALTGDVTDEDGVGRAFGEAAERFGRLDFVINNAGIRHQSPLAEHDVDVWRRTIDVNLTGTFICSQAAIRLMLERGGGAIVNLASIAGQLALRDRAAYNASKGGVMALTRSVTAEYAARGIRCNAIAPGLVETPLSAPYFRDERMRSIITTNTPVGRWAQTGEIASAALFLCGPGASFVQGETLFVDGGWNAAKGY